MLSAYRRCASGVVRTANGSRKPRRFSIHALKRASVSDLDGSAIGGTSGRRVFDTVRVDGTSTADAQQSPSNSTEPGYTSLTKPPGGEVPESTSIPEDRGFINRYKNALAPTKHTATAFPLKDLHIGLKYDILVRGFIGAQRKVGQLIFAPLTRGGKEVQLVCSRKDNPDAFEALLGKAIRPNSAIEILGNLRKKKARLPAEGEEVTKAEAWEEVELVVKDVKYLSKFPDDIPVGEVANYGPEQRHLQLRFDKDLAARLSFRSAMAKKVQALLQEFTQVDTPVLFKSTPEGAREFLVPTRKPGTAYALPQSPQQYKQILMASGVDRYFQLAHCFRDEDLRADRQPEFMQLDLEMAFCNGKMVMKRVEGLVKALWEQARTEFKVSHLVTNGSTNFPRTTYTKAMSKHGVDKPDLRIRDYIGQVDGILPSNLKKMMTSIEEPIIEAFKFHLAATPEEVREFVAEIMSSPEFLPFSTNADGPPGVFIYDPSKPLSGLSAFGHEGMENLEAFFQELRDEQFAARYKTEMREFQKEVEEIRRSKNGAALPAVPLKVPETIADKNKELLDWSMTVTQTDVLAAGDLIIMQARPNRRFEGGSTALGRLRRLVHRAAVEKGYMTMPEGFRPLWVTQFPLFTPNDGIDPGQGGSHGFSATHHPFTSPLTPKDVDLCVTNPLEAVADHYDLVINGVELGGGSGRIHDAEMQEFVLRDVLGMKPERVEDFRHLLEALRAGCPPHAGFALGWDRLIAMMCERESIRDVLAFPKDGKGKDALVGSPTEMTRSQLDTYHLDVQGPKAKLAEVDA